MCDTLTTEQVAEFLRIRISSLWSARQRGDHYLMARGNGPDRRRNYYLRTDVVAYLDDLDRDDRRLRDRDLAIMSAAKAGVRYEHLAETYGLKLSTISSIVRLAGIRNRPHRSMELRREAVAYARTHTFDEAALKYGVCRRALFVWASKGTQL